MHPLLILVLVFDLLIAVSSVLNLVNMMRVNLMVEERRAEALTVQRVPLTSARLFMSSGKMRLPLSSVMVVSNLRIHRA